VSKPLRPYQSEAVGNVLNEWQSVRATLLVLATGLGKTRTASEIAARRRPLGPTLWLAHREELLHQAVGALESDGGLSCQLERAEDKATPWSSEVVVASVQTLQQAGRLKRWPSSAISTIIVDEAHHSTSAGYRRILAHFPEAKVLGLTATPDRTDKVGLGNVFESCAFRYGIRDGIRDGYLAPIRARKIVCSKLDLRAVKVTAGDLSGADIEKAMKVEGVLHQIASPLVQEAGSRPTIVFCPTVAVAEELARVMSPYVGAGKVACISANTPREQRADILARYQAGEIQYITNCAVLTEGFDAPATACIAMCRPTKSRALYTQCVGRGTRLSSGKDHLLLLDFTAKWTRHDLQGPEDVLAGEDLDSLSPEVKERIREELEKGEGDLEDLIKKAVEAAELAEARAELERQRARLKVIVSYARHDMDVFPELSALATTAAKTFKPGPERATPAQRDFLMKYGISVPPEASKKSTGDVVTYVHKRGMATYKQARLLAQHNLRTDVRKQEASSIIDRLANNGWKPSPELVAEFGVARDVLRARS
jgi:superfamily II DNA or RNA helicase